VLWLGYAALVAGLIALYITAAMRGVGMGVDFACFRAASLLLAHGGNPYDVNQLWQQENLLYNVPHHLTPADVGYYPFDEYRNPPLFALLLTPLARLPFTAGYVIFTLAVVALAVVGSWLTLRALGWTERRVLATGIVLISPCVFLTIWNGQQSTLLLCVLGATLYALRQGRAGLAGALFALSWVKPHLLVPVALAVPLLLSWRPALRWCGGFGALTVLGLVATAVTSGGASIMAWLHSLLGYTGYIHVAQVADVSALQNYLPSLSGTALVWLPPPWNKLCAVAIMALGLGVMVTVVARAQRYRSAPWVGVCVLVAVWLLCTPYLHTHDDVLLLPALAAAWAWGHGGAPTGGRGLRRALPLLALWTITALPLAFVLPRPWSLLGLVPPVLICAGGLLARDKTGGTLEPRSAADVRPQSGDRVRAGTHGVG